MKRESPLERSLAWFSHQDDMGGFKTAAETHFPGWEPKRSCRAPHRDDRNPSFSVYKSAQGQWRFKDHATDEQGGLVGFVMLAGMDEKQAAHWLMDKAGMGSWKSSPSTPRLSLETKSRQWQPYAMTTAELKRCVVIAETLLRQEDAAQSIATARNWLPETLHKLARDPCLGLHLGKLVYIYPTGAKKRLRPLTPSGGNIYHGPDFIWMFGKPDALWRGDRVSQCTQRIFITEGETDAISLIDAGLETAPEILVVALPSATTFQPSWSDLLAGKDVVLCLDADNAGSAANQKIGRVLRPVVKSLQRLNWGGVLR